MKQNTDPTVFDAEVLFTVNGTSTVINGDEISTGGISADSGSFINLALGIPVQPFTPETPVGFIELDIAGKNYKIAVYST